MGFGFYPIDVIYRETLKSLFILGVIDSILNDSIKREESYEVTEDSYSLTGAKNSRLMVLLFPNKSEKTILNREVYTNFLKIMSFS